MSDLSDCIVVSEDGTHVEVDLPRAAAILGLPYGVMSQLDTNKVFEAVRQVAPLAHSFRLTGPKQADAGRGLSAGGGSGTRIGDILIE